MILVTGGTGFIGTHLLERLVAPAVANGTGPVFGQGAAPGIARGVAHGETVRALVRSTRAPRTLPAGVEAVYGDLATGEGIEEALRGADAVIHLAGVTKALRTGDYYVGN